MWLYGGGKSGGQTDAFIQPSKDGEIQLPIFNIKAADFNEFRKANECRPECGGNLQGRGFGWFGQCQNQFGTQEEYTLPVEKHTL